MPKQNRGTLLENIVVVEAMRLVAQGNDRNFPVDFFNSFAMAPLTDWADQHAYTGFTQAQLDRLRTSRQPLPADGYQGMLRACLQHPPERPGTQGPNGALLCAMLTHHLNCPLRLWLNDIPNGSYGNAIPCLETINETVQRVLDLPEEPQNEIIICDQGWPNSLIPPVPNNLRDTLAEWGDNAHARLGFLDPMKYSIDNAAANHTDSASHQRWLSLLSHGFARTVISVHFAANQYHARYEMEKRQMCADGLEFGYHRALHAGHSNYHVVCNIRHPDGVAASHALAIQLQQAVGASWNTWFQTTRCRRRPDPPHLEVI